MTPDHARALINRLRRLNDATRNGRPAILPAGTVTRLDLTERRLLAAIHRNLTPGPESDGYPNGQPGQGGEDAPQSTTEGAALHRLQHPTRDPLNADVTAALAHLQTAVNELAALTIRLDHIDDLANPGSRHSNPGGDCAACDRPVLGTAVDRLRRGMCHACYTAWIRDGRPDIIQFRTTRQGEAA